MDIGIISKRYAKALLAYAVECKAEDEVYQQMLTLCHSFMQVKELQPALINPVIDNATKISLLRQAAGGSLHAVNERFIELVFNQHRDRYLLFIFHSFIGLYRKFKHIVVGKLTTAVPLDEQIEQRLQRMVANATGGSVVEFNVKVDEEIQGGFILQLDNLRMDASIKGQLQQMKKQLCEHV